MARVITNPYTGLSIDYDSIPVYSTTRQQPGRFCPHTGNPMDDVALNNFTYAFGSEESNNRIRAQHEKHIASIKALLTRAVAPANPVK